MLTELFTRDPASWGADSTRWWMRSYMINSLLDGRFEARNSRCQLCRPDGRKRIINIWRKYNKIYNDMWEKANDNGIVP